MSVSIGLPYTDQGDLLGLAIQSILDQSFQEWELILVGDQPDEITKKVAHKFVDSRIRFYENSSRLGLAATLNRIAQLAAYPLLARMDGDDIMHPERIALQKQSFDEDPSMDVLGTRAYLIDEESNLVGLFTEPDLPASSGGYMKSNAFTHPSVMGKKKWFLENPYDEDLLRGEDKELWLRTFSHSKFMKIPDRLMFYRRPRRLSSTRMRRDESYNRLIMARYDRDDVAPNRIARMAFSYTKESILGAIPILGLSQALFNTKWTPAEAAEYRTAFGILEKIKQGSRDAVPASSTIAATVTYGDRYHLVERTVRAALNAGSTGVIIVDNGSSRTAKSALRSLADGDPRIQLVRLESNQGSAEGFATAVRTFGTTGADYLWLLDDDNVCREDALVELVHAASALEETAGGKPVGVCAVRPSNPLHAAIAQGKSAGRVYPPRGSFMYFDLSHRIISSVMKRVTRHQQTYDALVAVPYAPYGGLLISKRSLGIVGTPDSSLGLYEDDTDYTARIIDKGGRLALCRTAIVDDIDSKWTESNGHAGLAGLLHATDSKRIYFAVRNRVSFDVKQNGHVGVSARLVMNRLIFQVALWATAVRFGKMKQAREILQAEKDGLRRNFSRSFSDT